MEPIDSFTLAKHDGPYEKWPSRTRLFCGGVFTGTEIPGFLVKAQYRCDNGFLLITSHNARFEESNDFILLDPQFKILAKAQLRSPYSSYLLHAHWPISRRTLTLHYYLSVFYELAIERRTFGLGPKFLLRKLEEAELDQRALDSIQNLRERLAQTGLVPAVVVLPDNCPEQNPASDAIDDDPVSGLDRLQGA
jgi:hypothetical protein